MSLTKQYFKYVSQNIFGLLGTSCYILADTYFISQAAGTSGVALLNLCLPIYNFIFAIGPCWASARPPATPSSGRRATSGRSAISPRPALGDGVRPALHAGGHLLP